MGLGRALVTVLTCFLVSIVSEFSIAADQPKKPATMQAKNTPKKKSKKGSQKSQKPSVPPQESVKNSPPQKQFDSIKKDIFPEKPLPWNQKTQEPVSEQPNKIGRPTPDRPDTSLVCEKALSSPEYISVVSELATLDRNRSVSAFLMGLGLDISMVSWQDTGRHRNSAGGSNISDARLIALTATERGQIQTHVMPIIRLPNFEDKTVDVDLSEVTIPMGNAWGVKPFGVSLKTVLERLSTFTSFEEPIESLYLERDSQVLVSAQTSVLPVPSKGQAYFVPSLYNYSSSAGNPATLVLLVSNRGTSVTVLENNRDKIQSGESGQIIYHNDNGEKKPFVLERLKDVASTQEGKERLEELSKSGQSIAGQASVNQVLMIQVPLVHWQNRLTVPFFSLASMDGLESAQRRSIPKGLDTGVVDVAKFGVGKYIELNGLKGLKRDPTLPIRIDVVRYMASDTANLSEDEMRRIPEELRGIYEAGKNLGSLVTADNRTRITRNYQPWTMPWWSKVVIGYFPLPIGYRDYQSYFAERFGDSWIYRFSSEEAAVTTMNKYFAK